MTQQEFSRIMKLRKLTEEEYQRVVLAHQQATNITSHITGMPHVSGAKSMVENAIIKADVHMEIYLQLCREQSELLQKLRKEATERLPKEDCTIICRWYIERKKMTEIAIELGKTERHIYRKRKEAVATLCIDNQ